MSSSITSAMTPSSNGHFLRCKGQKVYFLPPHPWRSSRDESEIIKAEGYHVPVLLEESVEALVTRPDGLYIDCTSWRWRPLPTYIGATSPQGHLFGVDRDPDARDHCDTRPPLYLYPLQLPTHPPIHAVLRNRGCRWHPCRLGSLQPPLR